MLFLDFSVNLCSCAGLISLCLFESLLMSNQLGFKLLNFFCDNNHFTYNLLLILLILIIFASSPLHQAFELLPAIYCNNDFRHCIRHIIHISFLFQLVFNPLNVFLGLFLLKLQLLKNSYSLAEARAYYFCNVLPIFIGLDRLVKFANGDVDAVLAFVVTWLWPQVVWHGLGFVEISRFFIHIDIKLMTTKS